MTRRLRVPVPAGLGVAAACVALVASLPIIFPSYGGRDLRDLVREARQFLPVWAAFCGLIGALMMKVHERESVIVGAVPGRSRGEILDFESIRREVAIGLGVLLGLLPAIIAASGHHWSWQDATAVVALVFAVCSLIPVGALAGALTGFPVAMLAGPLAALVVVAVPAFVVNDILLLNRGASVMSTAYMWSTASPGPDERLTWQVVAIQCLFFLLVGFTARKAASGVAEWRAAGDATAASALAWLLFPAAVTAVLAPIQPVLAETDPAQRVRCVTGRELELCLYERDEGERQYLTDLFSPLVSYVGSQEGLVISQDEHTAGSLQRAVVMLSPLAGERREMATNDVRSGLVKVLGINPEACNARAPEGRPVVYSLVAEVSRRVGNSAADPAVRAVYASVIDEEPPDAAVATSFETMSDEAFQRWLVTHRDAISTCTVSGQDVP